MAIDAAHHFPYDALNSTQQVLLMSLNLQLQADKAMAALNNRQFKTAVKTTRMVLKSNPDQPFFANICGLALCGLGQHRNAIPYFQKAIHLNPNTVEAHRNLAQTLILLDQNEKARNYIEKILGRFSNDADLLYLLAQAHYKTNAFDDAIDAATRAIAANPTLGKAYNLRGIVRRHIEDPNGSVADYRKAIELNPNDVEALSNIAVPLMLLNHSDAAIETLKKALEISPEHISSLERYAGILNDTGRFDEARDVLLHVLEIAPKHPAALANLAPLLPIGEIAGFLPRLTSGFSSAPKASLDKINLGFAIWTAYKRNGDEEEALRWLDIANTQAYAIAPYNLGEKAALQESLFAPFTSGKAIKSPPIQDPAPIFVLGLIRSGTTLTEQVISSNPHVFGAGELGAAGYLITKMVRDGTDFDTGQAASFAKAYRNSLPEMPTGTRAFIDKMPGNYRLIGHLITAFPNCKILNLSRDPRAVAWSIWRNYFATNDHAYAYNFEAMAQHFNLYRQTMNRWHALYSDQIMDLSYRDLVSDIEATSRALADFCGIEWVEAMMNPQENKRAVMTASAHQVRQKVHTKSVAGWQKYADTLAPFIAGLDPKLWPEINET